MTLLTRTRTRIRTFASQNTSIHESQKYDIRNILGMYFSCLKKPVNCKFDSRGEGSIL